MVDKELLDKIAKAIKENVIIRPPTQEEWEAAARECRREQAQRRRQARKHCITISW